MGDILTSGLDTGLLNKSCLHCRRPRNTTVFLFDASSYRDDNNACVIDAEGEGSTNIDLDLGRPELMRGVQHPPCAFDIT